ncbi:nonstructural protein [Capybara microvirus Cap1_SP_140]|nr:nonstructural protein [Capybara microvirus Cap1_SP_140]
MNLKVYSVYDKKMNEYTVAFFFPDNVSCVRAFYNMFLSGNVSPVDYYNSAEDFEIYCVGFFDTSSGLLNAQTPQFCASMSDFKKIVLDNKELQKK